MSNALNNLNERIEFMRNNPEFLDSANPWGKTMGFRPTRIERGKVWALQPYDEKLLGDPETGVIHGGVITTLLDNLSGMSCAVTMEEFRFVATLDLRIDYMRPADKGRDIIGEAECYHLTKSVAFTRAWAYHETRDKVIATAQGAFAITMPRAQNTGDKS